MLYHGSQELKHKTLLQLMMDMINRHGETEIINLNQ